MRDEKVPHPVMRPPADTVEQYAHGQPQVVRGQQVRCHRVVPGLDQSTEAGQGCAAHRQVGGIDCADRCADHQIGLEAGLQQCT